MSMISEQVKKLQDIQERLDTDGELDMDILHIAKFWAQDIRDAIDTIETLSAKMCTKNLHNGWILCDERLPEENQRVLTCDKFGNVHINNYFMGRNNVPFGIDDNHSRFYPVVAWQPLPEGYKLFKRRYYDVL